MKFNEGFIKEVRVLALDKSNYTTDDSIRRSILIKLAIEPSINSLTYDNNKINERDLVYFKLDNTQLINGMYGCGLSYYEQLFEEKFFEIYDSADWYLKCPIEHFRIHDTNSSVQLKSVEVSDEYAEYASWMPTIKNIKNEKLRKEYTDKIRAALVDYQL